MTCSAAGHARREFRLHPEDGGGPWQGSSRGMTEPAPRCPENASQRGAGGWPHPLLVVARDWLGGGCPMPASHTGPASGGAGGWFLAGSRAHSPTAGFDLASPVPLPGSQCQVWGPAWGVPLCFICFTPDLDRKGLLCSWRSHGEIATSSTWNPLSLETKHKPEHQLWVWHSG